MNLSPSLYVPKTFTKCLDADKVIFFQLCKHANAGLFHCWMQIVFLLIAAFLDMNSSDMH